MTTTEKLPRVYPGKILKEEFLDEMEITPYRLAKCIGVPQSQISDIIQGKRAITPMTAIRLGLFFCNSKEFWLNLQQEYDLRRAMESLEEKGIEITCVDGSIASAGTVNH